MKLTILRGLALCIFAAAILSTQTAAQLAGNPVYAVTPSTGITLSADYGRGLKGDESPRTDFFGGRLVVGLPAVSFWVGGGAYDSRVPRSDLEITMGGGAAVNFLKSPVLPVSLSLQVGGGTVPCGAGCTSISAYAGPAIKFNIVGAVDIFQPWLMPRVHATRFSMSGANVNQIGFGGSGGFNINLPFGLGLHAVFDYSTFEETTSGAIVAQKRYPLVVGGGLHYYLKVPGFGVL